MAITLRLMVISVLLVYLCSVQDVFSEDSATVSSTEPLSISTPLNTTPEETSTEDTPNPVTSEPTTAETPTSPTNEATTQTSSTTDEVTGTSGTALTTDTGTSDDSPTTAPAGTTVDETSPTSGGTPEPTESSTPSNTDSTTDPDTSTVSEATPQTPFTTDEVTGTSEAVDTSMTTGAGTSDDSPTTAPAGTTVDETSPTSGVTQGTPDTSTPSNTDSTTDPDTSTVSEATPQTLFTTDAVTETSEAVDTGMTTDAGTSDDSPTTAPAGTTVDETSPTSGGTPGTPDTSLPSNTDSTTDPDSSTITEASSQTPFTTDAVTGTLETAGPGMTTDASTSGESPTSVPADTTVDESIPTSPRTSGPDDTVTTSGTAKTTDSPLSTLPATVGTTVIPTVCQNGGTLSGVTCICLPQFSGSKCEIFVPVTTPATVKRPVVVNMMLNERFNDKYLNNQSQEYKDFVGSFKQKMTTYYNSKIKETFEVVVTKVSPGKPLGKLTVNTVKKLSLEAMVTTENLGVNVVHEVILDIPNTPDQVEYNDTFKQIQSATEELANCEGEDCILDVSETTVEQAGVDLTRSCNGTIYEAILEESKVICVTACNEKHSNPKICYSGGECKVLTEAVCECKNTDTVWYLNDNCSHPLHRIGLIAGLSAAFVVLLASVAALVAFSVLNKRKQIKVKDQKKKQVNLYMEEEVEWPRPNSTAGSNRVGYNNPSYLDDNSGYAKRQTPPHRNSPPPSYPWSRPMTMSDGPTHVPQADQWRNDSGYARPANSAQYQGDIPLDHLMRVRRPQVRSSWDA